MLSKEEVLSSQNLFVASQATDYGKKIKNARDELWFGNKVSNIPTHTGWHSLWASIKLFCCLIFGVWCLVCGCLKKIVSMWPIFGLWSLLMSGDANNSCRGCKAYAGKGPFLVDLSLLNHLESFNLVYLQKSFSSVYCMVWCLVTPVSAVEASSSLVPTEAFLAPVDHQSAPRNHQRSLFLLVQLNPTHPVISRSTQTLSGKNFEKRLQGGWKKGSWRVAIGSMGRFCHKFAHKWERGEGAHLSQRG